MRLDKNGCLQPTAGLVVALTLLISHVLFVLPIFRQVFGHWSDVLSGSVFLPASCISFLLLYTWFNRIPEAGTVFRCIWRFGRELLLSAYLWSAGCLVWLNWSAFSNTDHRHFVAVVLLLLIDVSVMASLLLSSTVKTVFAEFPAHDQAEKQRDANAQLANAKRQLLQDAKLQAPIAPDNLAVAEQEARLRALITQDPNNALAWFELGVLAYGALKKDQALLHMKKALVCDSNNALILRSLCELFRQDGRVSEAVQYGREAVALAPEDEIAHLNLALALTDNKEPDTALTHYHRVIDINPHNVQAWLNMAVLLAQQNRKEDALAALDAVLIIEPAQVQAVALKKQLQS